MNSVCLVLHRSALHWGQSWLAVRPTGAGTAEGPSGCAGGHQFAVPATCSAVYAGGCRASLLVCLSLVNVWRTLTALTTCQKRAWLHANHH